MTEESDARRREVAERQARNLPFIEEYRAKGGIPQYLLLHHRGARTGAARVNPVAFWPVGGNFAVFASNQGRQANPDWFYNLLAHPETFVEVGPQTIEVVARVAAGQERSAIWAAWKAKTPPFAEYERTAAPREIPVVILERAVSRS